MKVFGTILGLIASAILGMIFGAGIAGYLILDDSEEGKEVKATLFKGANRLFGNASKEKKEEEHVCGFIRPEKN